MKRENRTWVMLLFILIFLLSAPKAEAREWIIVGPRALGMGGAHVAVSNDSAASYWNPAAYGFFKNKKKEEDYYGKRKWSSVLDVGVGVQIHEDLGESLSRILEYNFDDLDTGQISASNVDDYIQLINELKTFDENKDRAITITANAGLGTQVGHFGIGGYAFSEISAKGDLDMVNIAPISSGTAGADIITELSNTGNFNDGAPVPTGDHYFDTATKSELISAIAGMDNWDSASATDFVQAMDYGLSQAQQNGAVIPSDITTAIEDVAQLANDAQTGGSFADNESILLFKGIAIGEVPFTYGRAITEDFAIGGNIKFMKARVYNTAVKVFDTEFEDALDEARDDYKESETFGIDLGLLYHIKDNLRVGIVGRNLNSPKFDMKRVLPWDNNYIKEKPQVRAGVAYRPLDFITLALDFDLTKNESTISDNYKSQNIGGGAEFNVFKVLQLRAGLYKNMAKSDIEIVYTAGLGINLWLFNLDVGASMSGETSEIDGKDIPKETRVELALSFLF